MVDPISQVRRLGGVARTRELLAVGVSAHHLAYSVHTGVLIRVRQGCFVLPETPGDVVKAVRVGGRLTAVSAASHFGLATPADHPIHVHVAPNSARLRQPDDRFRRLERDPASIVIHHHALLFDEGSTKWAVSLLDCLRQVIMTESTEDAVACVDSARHRRLLDLIGVEELRRNIPNRTTSVLDLSTDLSPEYLESVFRVRLAIAGIPSRIQVNVLDERWIDVLVGDRLAFECDGRGKYERGATVHSDRARDAFLEALGYHVIRLSYAMVIHDWEATLAMILAIIERGDHLARR